MKNRIRELIKKFFFYIYYFFASVYIPQEYRKAYRHGELSYLTFEDYRIWRTAMIQMLHQYCKNGYNLRVRQVIDTFARSKIHVIRKTDITTISSPIVVLCVKNDRQRLQMLVDHYRNLGIERFAFLDNASNDGTYEWCMDQKDIDLFRCYEPYQTLVKEGWINRLISYYGFNRWYIITDSDELIVYKEMEIHPLADLIEYAQQHGMKRFKGLTLDTYSEDRLFGKTNNIRESYCWIDTDSYMEVETQRGNKKVKRMMGGPRYRLMHSNITLSKFPIVYFEPGTISDSAHYQYPHDVIDTTPCTLGILHYKFIDKDLDVYERRAQKQSGFSLNGKFYKQYLEFLKNNQEASFFYEGSVKYENSNTLDAIDLIQSIHFDQN